METARFQLSNAKNLIFFISLSFYDEKTQTTLEIRTTRATPPSTRKNSIIGDLPNLDSTTQTISIYKPLVKTTFFESILKYFDLCHLDQGGDQV